jgi:guanylate kinase
MTLKDMRNLYIVGPSCGGKTTLLHYLHKHFEEGNIPRRYLTRNPRNEHDSLENGFLEKDSFLAMRAAGDFFISWHRVFPDNRVEYYGFLKSDISENQLNIFSSNNALLLYPDSIQPEGILQQEKSFFIACTAPKEVRMTRLKDRSPEYDAAEVQVRIQGESIDKYLGTMDLVLDTSELSPEVNGAKVLEFLRKI